jgi:hypothetical protein
MAATASDLLAGARQQGLDCLKKGSRVAGNAHPYVFLDAPTAGPG